MVIEWSAAASCEVIATTTRSCIWSLKASGEITSAGRRFEELRSVNGNGTRTMSPRLQRVVNGIGWIVPELEALLRSLQPAKRLADLVELLVREDRVPLPRTRA